MKRFYSKKDKAIKEAFHMYEQAKQKGYPNPRSTGKNPSDAFIDGYEESRTEDRIYTLIKKMPIKNPRKKARRICIAVLSLFLLAILFVCFLFDKP